MRLALYQPDIPPNTGTILRLCACLEIGVDIIEPCGFALGDRAFRRAGLDYLDSVSLRRHPSWAAYRSAFRGRLVLLTTRASGAYTAFSFHAADTIMLGRESAGVPAEVHAAADARIVIPMRAGARSLNVAVAAAMALGEALRQTAQFPAVNEPRPASEARA